jgi:hypothetical protein
MPAGARHGGRFRPRQEYMVISNGILADRHSGIDFCVVSAALALTPHWPGVGMLRLHSASRCEAEITPSMTGFVLSYVSLVFRVPEC